MLRRAGDGVELIEPDDLEALVGPSGLESPGEPSAGRAARQRPSFSFAQADGSPAEPAPRRED